MKPQYDNIAQQWSASRTTFCHKEKAYLEALLAAEVSKRAVLDLGSGHGRPMAEFVLSHGFSLTGVDRSNALLEEARHSFPAARWINAEMEEVDFDSEQFAAVICWDALFHVEREKHSPLLAKIYNWLVPGGRFLWSTGGSANPPFTDTMWGHEFPYDSLPPDEAVATIKSIGFQVLMSELVDPPTGGRDKGKLAILAEKPSHQKSL